MSELINSLKTFAYSGTISGDRKYSGQSSADTSFFQWRDAMRMVARLPGGLPNEFRLKLWENLSEKYLSEKGISWSRIVSKSTTPTSRDSEIADQIHKDLHRTGCTGFSSGAKQAKLKSVLVSYGRWNPTVGYCQGFNMIGAMLLEMTMGDETLSLKVLIFLIEGVLPKGYFSGGLRGLAVDMAVFREILRMRKPSLHAQLSRRILEVKSADEFYSVMGVVTREMLEFGLMEPNSLVKCIVSVGPFPFPGLGDLRQKHWALISQDTPYKSFFLAKRELDNLKKHYAAIRHRQKATTIILKGLEASSRLKVAGQRSHSLFIPTSNNRGRHSALLSPKTKVRRGGAGAPAPLANCNNNNNNNKCNNRQGSGGGSSVKSLGKVAGNVSKIKNFRRRRTLSVTSSSSSSTELCDSSSDSDSSSDGVWSDSDKQWKNKVGRKETLLHQTKDSSKENESPGEDVVSPSLRLSPLSPQKSPTGSIASSIIDTNDSQHFLDEMSKLGKSDSFYESLSKRICELQFQNLKTLSNCVTVIDPASLTLPPFPKSPLPSPMSPYPTPPPPPPEMEEDKELLLLLEGNMEIPSNRKSSHSVSPSDLGLAPPRSPPPPPKIAEEPQQLEFPESVSGTSTLSPTITVPSSPQKREDDEEDEGGIPSIHIQAPHPTLLVLPEEESSCFLFPEVEEEEEEERMVNGGSSPEGEVLCGFPTTTCPAQTQLQMEEEEIQINAVIRENIAILQRLKLSKAAYFEEDGDESYEDASEEEDKRSGSEGADSGVPSSSKNSQTTTKERCSSVSSTSSGSSNRRPRKKLSTFGFNPFPTVRKARLRLTKYGLYN